MMADLILLFGLTFLSVRAYAFLAAAGPRVTNCDTKLSAKRRGGSSKQSAASSAGFGAKTTATATTVKQQRNNVRASSFTLQENVSIERYLNHPELLRDNPNLADRMLAGELVVIRDAFQPDFAEAMYQELVSTDAWSKNEDYFGDGYGFRHYNVYDKKDYSPLFLSAINMFDSEDSKEFMTKVTGRDCTGETVGAPSYYESGDHSLPHTDHIGQRTVAYIWHLSKKWKPEWGGGLYWAPEPLANAYIHASFNTLVLFSVTPHSSHFVTTVSPHAREKRLAFNGWWQSSWVPTINDFPEDKLKTPEQRLSLTHAQIEAICDMLDDPWEPRIEPPERRVRIEEIRSNIMAELYPPPRRYDVKEK